MGLAASLSSGAATGVTLEDGGGGGRARTRRRMPLRTHLTRIAAVLLLVALAAGARGEDPLSTADVIRFLRAGISERIILAELKDRGFAEALDSDRETRLRDVGATETLVVAIRRVAPLADVS